MTSNVKTKKINYEKWSQNDLIKEIQKLNKRKKYGLVWDEERTKEIFEQEAEEKLPVLVDVTKNGIEDKSKLNNILIEGDNYHTLSVLNYTHKGKIDVIYIDPPYNTGNNTWKYNNNFVDKDDDFRHSKWLSFIGKRLKLAKKLLTKSGIILVTIDDYEIHNLRALMDDIFSENNRLGTIAIMHNPRGRSDDKFLATSHEYMLVYGKNSEYSKINHLKLTEEQKEAFSFEDEISKYRLLPLQRSGSNSRRINRPNLYYPIYYNVKTKEISLQKTKNFIEIIPIDSSGNERVWRWGKNSLESRLKTEIVIKESKNSFNVYAKDRIKAGRKSKTMWVDPKYDASSHGTILLKQILGDDNLFDFPKSLYAVMDSLSISSKKDSIILDFFAGSGTTGHAVMELNKEDKGNRKFILCTNNENNICTDVCYPRLKKIIKGYKNSKNEKVEGLGGNLKYFKTSFVDSEPTNQNKKIMVAQSTEMICLKEDCFELVKEGKQFRIFKNHDECYLGIIYYYDGIDPFKKEILKLNKKINTYVFSLVDEVDEEGFEDVRSLVTLKPIPSAILNVYKRIFAYVQTKKLPRKTRQ